MFLLKSSSSSSSLIHALSRGLQLTHTLLLHVRSIAEDVEGLMHGSVRLGHATGSSH